VNFIFKKIIIAFFLGLFFVACESDQLYKHAPNESWNVQQATEAGNPEQITSGLIVVCSNQQGCKKVEWNLWDLYEDDPVCRADIVSDGKVDSLDVLLFDKFLLEAAYALPDTTCYPSSCVNDHQEEIDICLGFSLEIALENDTLSVYQYHHYCYRQYCEPIYCPFDLNQDRRFDKTDQTFIYDQSGKTCFEHECDENCEEEKTELEIWSSKFSKKVGKGNPKSSYFEQLQNLRAQAQEELHWMLEESSVEGLRITSD